MLAFPDPFRVCAILEVRLRQTNLCPSFCALECEMASYEPEPRKGHAAVGVEETLYVWGGDGGSTTILTRVVERFDVSSQEWKRPQQLSRRYGLPDGLSGMAVTVDSERAYFFGGRTDSGSYSNTPFEVDLSVLQCRELSPTDSSGSGAPKKKSFSAMVYFNEKLVIYGGFTGLNQTDELNVFDLKTRKFENSMQML